MIWEAETKRSIWALLGESYSDMRDHHEEAIPMEKFLSLAVPLLPLIPADLYLVKMGWQLTTNSDGEAELSRDPKFNADLLAVEYPARTNLSSKDIVNHCYNQGLANRAHRERKPTLRELTLRDRMANRPAAANKAPPPACGGTLTLAVAPQSVSQCTWKCVCSDTYILVQVQSVASPATSTEGSELQAGSESPDAIFNSVNTTPSALNSDYLTIEAVTADQQQAYARYDQAVHFHPNISPPILGFDPRIIQDDFDPFNLDLSSIIDFDA